MSFARINGFRFGGPHHHGAYQSSLRCAVCRDLKAENGPGSSFRIKLVHNGDMKVAEPKIVRQSVSLPVKVASQVRTMAKSRKLSATRMLVELIENGIEAEKRKQQEFFELAERFRSESNPEAAKRLGDQLGRMVFGG